MVKETSTPLSPRRIILGVTGASGSRYALRLLDALLASGTEVHFVTSDTGAQVFEYETGLGLDATLEDRAKRHPGLLHTYAPRDLFAPIASGSFPVSGMAVLPCSMSTAAAVAQGVGGNLLRRAADVQLKERRPLVLVPRETPLSLIHLRSLLSLAEAGAVVLPAAPGFYGRPSSIEDLLDFIVGRTMDALGLPGSPAPQWTGAEL